MYIYIIHIYIYTYIYIYIYTYRYTYICKLPCYPHTSGPIQWACGDDGLEPSAIARPRKLFWEPILKPVMSIFD